jgi:hypothetical protein
VQVEEVARGHLLEDALVIQVEGNHGSVLLAQVARCLHVLNVLRQHDGTATLASEYGIRM